MTQGSREVRARMRLGLYKAQAWRSASQSGFIGPQAPSELYTVPTQKCPTGDCRLRTGGGGAAVWREVRARVARARPLGRIRQLTSLQTVQGVRW